MKYTILPYDDSLAHGPLRYLIDKDSDISELPTDCSVGSKVVVAESGNTYLLNNQHEWKKQITSSGDESGGSSLLRPAMTTPAISVDVEATHYDRSNFDGAVVERAFVLGQDEDNFAAISSKPFSVTLTYTRKTDSQEATETIVVPTTYMSEPKYHNIEHPSIRMYGNSGLYSCIDEEHPENNIIIGLEPIWDESYTAYSHHNLYIMPRGQAKIGTNFHIEISEIEWQTITDEFILAYYIMSNLRNGQ